MALDIAEFFHAGLGERHKLGTAVLGVRPARDQALFLEIGNVPAEYGGANAEPGRKVRGPGFPLPHESQDSLKRKPGFLPPGVCDSHAADCPLEVEDLVDESGCGVWFNGYGGTPLYLP